MTSPLEKHDHPEDGLGSAVTGGKSPSLSSAALDAKAEKRLLRKIDMTVFPILFVLYMMSFLDRINISNARIQKMDRDLDLSGNHYNIALFIYFIPYILLEVPSNIIIRKTRPSWYLSGLALMWGVISLCMGFVQSYESLVGLRFLLGAAEAGVLPGIIYLTSMYYKKHEFQLRMSFFFCSTLIGGAFGGLLAYAIAKLDGLAGLAAWRWIFILEGTATALLAIAAAFLIVDWPEQTRFLNADEKELLRRRLAADLPNPRDGSQGVAFRMDTLDARAMRLILTDFKIWLGALIYMGVGTTGYATTFFMPTVLVEFGWTAESAQIHTIPVYVACAAGMLGAAWASDHLRHRCGFILLGCSLSTVGFALLLTQGQNSWSSEVKYAAIFLAALGGYIGTPLSLGWLANNVAGHWKRAFSSSIQVMLGNLAGIIGTTVFLERESPRYLTGYGVTLGMMWMGGISALAMALLMWMENKKRDRGERDDRLLLPPEQADNLGDSHPAFRFTL